MDLENERQFNPYRFRLARNCRDLTKKELAKRMHVTPLTLTRLEKGENEPDNNTIASLVNALGFSERFFFEGNEEDQCKDDLDTKDLSFRSKATISRRERNSAYSTRGLAYIVDAWIQDNFNLPSIDVPDLSRDCDPVVASEQLRYEWQVGNQPILNVMKLLEARGIRIYSFAEASGAIDAFSCWDNGVPYIFLNTNKNAERTRFNLCHELGHLVLHRNVQHQTSVDIEKEANCFASAFLMPEADVRSHLYYGVMINELVNIKKRWKVSVAALAYRARQLGLLSEWQYRSVAIEIQKRNYRKEEPNPAEKEYSFLWKELFKMLWREKITREQLAKTLYIPYEDFNKLVSGLLNAPIVTTCLDQLKVIESSEKRVPRRCFKEV